MTPLPQRKKTAEEIAKLRDQLGVPSSVESDTTAAAPSMPAEPSPEPVQAPQVRPIDNLDKTAAKSLWLPAPTYPFPIGGAAGSKLPAKRRSASELEEMRRREMLSKMSEPPPTNIKFMAAHPALIGLGYLLAAGGICSFWVDAYPWVAIILGSVLALALGIFIALRRPVSRHHAGFISAISVLVGVFATIHHFPQLQHAS